MCPNVAPQFLVTDTLNSEHMLAGVYLSFLSRYLGVSVGKLAAEDLCSEPALPVTDHDAKRAYDFLGMNAKVDDRQGCYIWVSFRSCLIGVRIRGGHYSN